MPLAFRPRFVVGVPLLSLLVVVVGDCAADAPDTVAEVVTSGDAASSSVGENVLHAIVIE